MVESRLTRVLLRFGAGLTLAFIYLPLVLIAPGGCGVFKAPRNALSVARKNRTLFVRVVADRNNVIEVLISEFVDGLRAMAGDVYANLPHRGYCFLPHVCWINPGAGYFTAVACIVP